MLRRDFSCYQKCGAAAARRVIVGRQCSRTTSRATNACGAWLFQKLLVAREVRLADQRVESPCKERGLPGCTTHRHGPGKSDTHTRACDMPWVGRGAERRICARRWAGVQTRKHPDTETPRYENAQVRKYPGAEVPRYGSAQLRKCLAAEMSGYGNAQLQKCTATETPSYRNAQLRTCRATGNLAQDQTETKRTKKQ